MKSLLPILLIVTTTAFGQRIDQAPPRQIHNSNGQIIAQKYADGTYETYSYDSAKRLARFTDRTGKTTFYPAIVRPNADAAPVPDKKKNPKPTPTPTATPSPTPSGTPPDSSLYTNYSLSSDASNVSWVVCGSTQQTSGCYSAGNLGTFGKIGALLEDKPKVNGNTVTRNIYVLDIASGDNSNGVTLYVYQKTDSISPSSDTIDVTLSQTISLSLVGGTSAQASMAANDTILMVGTNQSPQAFEVQKSNFAITGVGGFSPPINVTGITSDQYGYITVTFGSFYGGENGYYVFGPDGGGQGDGGGADFMVNTDQAVLPGTLP